ncbi:hypothetical protein [Novosphingobium sp. HII-3]|uniref:hypothetical protein n=1 Tax=Novosphingobium sp. HII-3 TaxID=2075565 RepID=UPI000CDB1D7E|nr:hypothetical protein [Novosphingobium sp. HII-3]
MNAIVTIEAPSLPLPPGLSCDDWLAIGRDLMRKDRETKWQTSDWMAYGRARARTDSTFASQMEMHLPEMAEDRRHLDAIARVAELFPPEERSLDLSFDAYAKLSRLPHGEARKILDQAAKEKTPPREIGYQAMQMQMAILPRAEPDSDSQLLSLIHLWNRTPRSVREEFAEMVGEADGQEIEP